MRVSVFIAASLDGYIARSDGDIEWLHNPRYAIEGEDFGYAAFNADVDAIVMGRGTYEKVCEFPFWPYSGSRVIVLSAKLTGKDSRVEVSRLAPRELVADLETKGCRKIYLDGGKVIQSFLRENLVSDMVLTRIPILLGSGLPLFGDLAGDLHWKHTGTLSWPNGFVQSRYEIVGV